MPSVPSASAYAAVPVNSTTTKEGDSGRAKWNHNTEFILSCIGFAVGLGNVWRFPYLCYRNGGGAFLIPYFIMMVLAGLPLFVLELGFGQFPSKGCITLWSVSPLFKGLGFAMCLITTMVCAYYNVIITYTIYYLFASFSKVLPWSTCGNSWNTPNCTISIKSRTDVNVTGYLGNETDYNKTSLPLMYQTRPSMEFWNNRVLERTDGIHDLGIIRWQLLLCLILAWVVVYLCIIKGIKSSGKVVYVTATFPYVVLFILLIRGVTLPGAADGILYYIKPNFSKLQDANVWKDAAVQIFFSLGLAFGCLHTMASFNQFHNNFYRDGIMITLINCGTSVFAGFVIFSVIGFMSYSSGLPIDKVADSGPGLAFVVYPEAIARMPIAPLWSVLFFLMLFTLGLDSMFADVETVITAICDEVQQSIYPDVNKKKSLICLLVCIAMCLINLIMVTQGGIYVVTLIDNYSAGMSLLVVAFLECIVISYVYGIDRFCEDMSSMLGFKLGLYWKVCMMFLSPLVLLFIFIFYCIGYSPLTYAEYSYPPWAQAIGWLLVVVVIAMIPGFAIWHLVTQTEGTPKQRLRIAIRPAPEWGPANNQDRITAGYAVFEKQKKDLELSSPPPEYSALCENADDTQLDNVNAKPKRKTTLV